MYSHKKKEVCHQPSHQFSTNYSVRDIFRLSEEHAHSVETVSVLDEPLCFRMRHKDSASVELQSHLGGSPPGCM